ncbi:hypothetical protein Trco_000959 [Trichoderma cornu-damae]|uniref:Uncharacterized protein n=1 Tax=Trichoderma cornu-damae TaxID=654480 RepID=A0A9P8TZI1_9HYPO|nr:hypothetical protein Trco_000959 [Trichoderma cornu-damae]
MLTSNRPKIPFCFRLFSFTCSLLFSLSTSSDLSLTGCLLLGLTSFPFLFCCSDGLSVVTGINIIVIVIVIVIAIVIVIVIVIIVCVVTYLKSTVLIIILFFIIVIDILVGVSSLLSSLLSSFTGGLLFHSPCRIVAKMSQSFTVFLGQFAFLIPLLQEVVYFLLLFGD